MKPIDKYERRSNGNYIRELNDGTGDRVILFQNNNNFGFWNYMIQTADSDTVWGSEEQATAANLAEVLDDVWEDIAKAMGSIR